MVPKAEILAPASHNKNLLSGLCNQFLIMGRESAPFVAEL